MTSARPNEPRHDAETLLHAYIDGELDAAESAAMERRIAADSNLTAQHQSLLALRQLMQKSLPRHHLAPQLRQDVIRRYARPVRGMPDWRALAAGLLLGAALAGSLTYGIVAPQRADGPRAAILAAHQRSLLAAQPFDIASSDRHVVKPWLSAKLATSPLVLDLGAREFPLVGGRIDIVDQRAVATLVYRRREHLISLTALPLDPKAQKRTEPSPAGSSGGYSLLNWQDGDFSYYAVSDLPPSELQAFAEAFRQAAGEK